MFNFWSDEVPPALPGPDTRAILGVGDAVCRGGYDWALQNQAVGLGRLVAEGRKSLFSVPPCSRLVDSREDLAQVIAVIELRCIGERHQGLCRAAGQNGGPREASGG